MDEYEKLARRANARLRRLEKAGRAFWAYDSATVYTQKAYGKNRFPQSPRNMSERAQRRNLREIQKFLGLRTSTVSGSRAVEKQIVDTFRSGKHNFQIADKRDFFNFLSSSVFKDISNRTMDSERLIEFYDRMSSEQGADLDTITDALEEWQKSASEGVEDLYNKYGMSIFDERD